MDVQPALSLHQRMTTAANELDFDAQALIAPLAEAAELLGGAVPDVVTGARRTAEGLRASAEELHGRIRMVLAGGTEMNAGLAALERIRSSFTQIESRGNPERADGRLSRRDLQWARHNLDEETSAAAEWLLKNESFFDRVETAKHNDDYIKQPYDSEFGFDPEDRDGLLSLDDIDAFASKTAAWATLLPFAAAIDTAGRGGSPDGTLRRRDFESFLEDYLIAPEVARAVRQVLDDGAYHTPDSPISWGLALDTLSFVPVIGDVVDGARAIHYALHGDWASAGIYALGVVPLPGLSGSGVKASVTVVKATVGAVQKRGYKVAARETADVVKKGTTLNWTASTAAGAASSAVNCSSTVHWISEQVGFDFGKFDRDMKKTTGEDVGTIRNRLSDITGYDLGIADGFFSDTCEMIARRIGEHKFSRSWLPG